MAALPSRPGRRSPTSGRWTNGSYLLSFTPPRFAGRGFFQPTWDGAHPTGEFRLDDHFLARIPNASSISPITGTRWECVGVIPDIAAPPAEALRAAKAHLLRSDLKTAGVRPMLAAQ